MNKTVPMYLCAYVPMLLRALPSIVHSLFAVPRSLFTLRHPTRAHRHIGTWAHSGFTLLELLIVISIIAILAAAIVPNFIGFDAEARIATTQTNLNTLRTRVTLFRAKEGRNPETLEELLAATYEDLGAQIPYLEEMPAELISEKAGNNSVENLPSKEDLSNDGGWTYVTDRRKVVVDVTEPLDGSWGSYEGEVPADW